MKVLISLALVCACSLPVSGQDPFIKVMAGGSVTVLPDTATLDVILIQNDETVELADAAFSKAKRKLDEVFNQMEFPNLEIAFHGPQLHRSSGNNNPPHLPPAMAPGAPAFVPVAPVHADQPSKEFAIRESIELRLKIDPDTTPAELHARVHQIVENMPEAQLRFATPTNVNDAAPLSLVRYRHSNPEQAKQEAAKNALAAAKRRANALAEMSGRMLGKVVSIVEKPNIIDFYGGSYPVSLAAYLPATANSNGQFGEITVRANFEVTFEIR